MTYIACFAIGFIGGFAGGFRVAAMIRLSIQKLAPQPDDVREDFV